MQSISNNYLLIGDGRLANHFRHYFALLDIYYESWSRNKNTLDELNIKIQYANKIILLISDSAIESFANRYLKEYLQNPGLDKLVIHCSGSLTCENIIGVHPLQSFAKNQKYSIEEYRQICFFYDKNKQALEFSDIFPDLPNSSFAIELDQKPFYHALCVSANNFTTILWQVFATRMADKFNVPFDKLKYYVETTSKNIQKDINTALTGPLIREDKNTIAANLNSLKTDDFEMVYKAFCDFYESKIINNRRKQK